MIRVRWTSYANRVASWAPQVWRPAIRYCSVLPALPAVRYLRYNARPLPWFRDDLHLKSLDAWGLTEAHSIDAWIESWQSVWPRTTPSQAGALASFRDTVADHLHLMRDETLNGDELREGLAMSFIRFFRRYAQSPVAVFCHLGLTALDIERMRGGLTLRSLFAAGEGGR
jgi:hypothetical protein